MSSNKSKKSSFLFYDTDADKNVRGKVDIIDDPATHEVLASLLRNTKRKKDGTYPHILKSRFDVKDNESYDSIREACIDLSAMHIIVKKGNENWGLVIFQIISLKKGMVSAKFAPNLGDNILIPLIDCLTNRFCHEHQKESKKKPSFVPYVEDGTWSISCPVENLERRLF